MKRRRRESPLVVPILFCERNKNIFGKENVRPAYGPPVRLILLK